MATALEQIYQLYPQLPFGHCRDTNRQIVLIGEKVAGTSIAAAVRHYRVYAVACRLMTTDCYEVKWH